MRSEASYFSESWPANSRDWFLMLSIAMCMMELARYATSIHTGDRVEDVEEESHRPSPEFPGNFTSVPIRILEHQLVDYIPPTASEHGNGPMPAVYSCVGFGLAVFRRLSETPRPHKPGRDRSEPQLLRQRPRSTLASSRPGMRR